MQMIRLSGTEIHGLDGMWFVNCASIAPGNGRSVGRSVGRPDGQMQGSAIGLKQKLERN